MKIDNFEIYQFRIPLRKILQIKNKRISIRTGYIIIIRDREGCFGAGEVSPLPGLHKESYAYALEQLKKVKPLLLHQTIPDNLQILDGGFTRWLNQYNLSSSVQFGIETAVLNLLADHYQKPLYSLLSNHYQKRIMVNGLVISGDPHIYRKIEAMLDQGYKSIKIKVGRLDIDQEIQIINTIMKFIKGKVLVRLDANQSWDFNQALHFIKSIDKDKIEYIEEPLKDNSMLEQLFNKTKIPVALDESLLTDHLTSPEASIANMNWLHALILKPSLLGGLERAMHYMNIAEKNNKLAVISDTFHSGIGIALLACFTAAKVIRKTAVGLNTYQWFAKDLLSQRLSFNRGLLNISNVYNKSIKLKMSLLKKIDI